MDSPADIPASEIAGFDQYSTELRWIINTVRDHHRRGCKRSNMCVGGTVLQYLSQFNPQTAGVLLLAALAHLANTDIWKGGEHDGLDPTAEPTG